MGQPPFEDALAELIKEYGKSLTDNQVIVGLETALAAVKALSGDGEESGGPYTCMHCCASTWNDDDWCDECLEETRSRNAEAEK